LAVRTYMFAGATDTGPQMLAFRTGSLLIGRLPDNHLALNHSSVSRRHARLSVSQNGVQLEDMGSQNGTTINGVAVKTPTGVRPGDILRIGHVPLYYFGFIDPEDPPEPTLVESGIVVNPVLPQIH